MSPEFKHLEGQKPYKFVVSDPNRLLGFSAYPSVAEHKASRGKSYRAQVIETLWQMVFFAVAFLAGALARGATCR